MPRQRRGAAPAPSRPSVSAPAARPTVSPPQTRPATTAAYPPKAPNAQQAPQQNQGGPGLFGQMASTAAGVAVGSSIGHALGGFFGGSSTTPEAQQADAALQAQSQNQSLQRTCDNDARAFTNCLDQNKGEHAMSICGWYLDQLKACQSAASQFTGQSYQ